MDDVQSFADTRQLPIQKVGIRSVKYPMSIARDDGTVHGTVVDFEMTVFLPADQKGTHMSRFSELLEAHGQGALSLSSFKRLLQDMIARLDAPAGYIKAIFPYFLVKRAPVSGVSSLMDYQLSFEGEIDANGSRLWLTVQVPVTSLCPCSKKISAYGAHNQRSHITVRIETAESCRIDDLIRLIEQQASCELYGLLKRPDEKYVTERAYDNPKFVEDLVRDVALIVSRFTGVSHYWVEAENFESIHNHSAFARIQSA
ncbi:MAG: GTP cyclohydrolase FolE2 [Burkholderiaceae bacterium]